MNISQLVSDYHKFITRGELIINKTQALLRGWWENVGKVFSMGKCQPVVGVVVIVW